MFLSIKGFTAIMAGLDYDEMGPGQIRGFLQIPNTDYDAIAFDLVIKNPMENPRSKFAPVILFIIVHRVLSWRIPLP